MSKIGRTYAVVSMLAFKKSNFDLAKAENQSGSSIPKIINTSFETIRLSLDGSLAIVKWRESDPIAMIPYIVNKFDLPGMQNYIEKNSVGWDEPLAVPKS